MGGEAIDLFRRVLGRPAAGSPEAPAEPAEAVEVQPPPVDIDEPAPPSTGIACPSCGVLLDPPPVRNRLCPNCRRPIVVRKLDGRLHLFAEEAVAVFDTERQRELDATTQTADRERWLRLAGSVGVASARRARLAAAAISPRAVESARLAYLAGADLAARKAAREKRWADVARIRRAEAAALFAAAGAPVPPPEEIAALHREGMLAVLRSFGPRSGAELVSGGCCKACRADDGKTFRIATELKEPRLPHPDCPRGLCACDWWIGVFERKRRRRRPARPVDI